MKQNYTYDCKHFFGIITANSKEDAAKKLKSVHGKKNCHPNMISKKIEGDCQVNCKLKLKGK